MIEFLSQYWPYIAIACCELATLTISLIIYRIRGISPDAIKVIIADKLPVFIKLAEETGEDGHVKLSFVIDAIYKVIKKYIRKADQSYWLSYIHEQVELVLSTPQKKEIVK